MVESRLDFTFDETFHVVKFDSTDFYKMFYSSMPNTYKRRYFEVRKAG